MKLDIANNTYWFNSKEGERFHFLADTPTGQGLSHHCAFFSAVAPSRLLSSPGDSGSDLFRQAIQDVHLDQSGKMLLLKQLHDNEDVCTAKLGRTNLLQHKIFVTQEVPIRQKPYRVSPAKLEVMKRQIDKMLTDNIIEPSSSAWAAPVVLIPKKTGVDPRFCVDFRKLNSVTLDDAYPLPTIQEILDSLGGAKVFTTLDLNSGYWQVNMDAESREKTACVSSVLWASTNLRLCLLV